MTKKNDDEWGLKRHLFDDQGNFRIGSDISKLSSTEAENKRLNKAIGSIELFSFFSILWIAGSFYGFVILHNLAVGCIFLALVLVCLISFIIIILNARK